MSIISQLAEPVNFQLMIEDQFLSSLDEESESNEPELEYFDSNDGDEYYYED
jgi:hypothetical protein